MENDKQMLEALASYGGLSLLVVGLVGGLKHLWKAWVAGKEPVLALILTLVIGILAKVGGLYGGPGGENAVLAWLVHVLLLVGTALGAGIAHDKLINPIFKGKSE